MNVVDLQRLPDHIAIIMDGNGRWAQLAGRPRPEGHQRGSNAVRRVVKVARRLGIRALTLYAFSEQNWSRPHTEVVSLMCLLRDFLREERDEILMHDIRLRSIGRTQRLPSYVREVLNPLEKASITCQGMTLTLALSYGGREEIIDATRHIAERVKKGELAVSAINETLLAAALPSLAPGPVDLLIRTGGEQRISNFVLWAAAYAELFFSAKLWPDFDEYDLFEAIYAFQARQRRFGRLTSDMALPTETITCSIQPTSQSRARHG